MLMSHLSPDRIVQTISKQARKYACRSFNKIIVPINVKSTHWYLGVVRVVPSGGYILETQNNCGTIINDQAENNLVMVGRALSRTVQHISEMETPVKHRYQFSDCPDAQRRIESSSSQESRSRLLQNQYSRCLLAEFTDVAGRHDPESYQSSQSSEQVDYGTQPERMEEYDDYDWETDRKVRYRFSNGKWSCMY